MNPEFQRNLYLEFSYARLVGMPAFLLVVFSLTYLIDGKILDQATANTAMGLYIAIVLFWGAKQSAECIFEEFRNNTWDIQKTSAISPWSLSWGKLFGSTLYNWYGGLICLLVYGIASSELEYNMLSWVYLLAGGLLAQSLSLLASLFSLRRKQSFNSSFSYLFALFILLSIVPVILNIDKFYNDAIYWYGEKFKLAYFSASSLVIACIWAIVGIYRLLSDELKMRTLPWVWIAFIAFVIMYLAGIMDTDVKGRQIDLGVSLALVGFCVCISLSYLLLFFDENNPMVLRKVWIYIEQGQWLRVLQEIPCWVVSMVLALPAVVILTMFYPMEKIGEINLYPWVIFLLMLRDSCILLFFSYAPNPRRALSLTLLYMISLYALLPVIFQSMNADFIAGLLLPALNNNLLLATLFASLQTLFISFLLFQRWQKRVTDARKQSIEHN